MLEKKNQLWVSVSVLATKQKELLVDRTTETIIYDYTTNKLALVQVVQALYINDSLNCVYTMCHFPWDTNTSGAHTIYLTILIF